MAEQQWRYQAYLLRVWWTSNGVDLVMRASLEDPQTGQRRGFGSLEQLAACITAQTGDGDNEPDGTPGGMNER
jgi:hypothetical protein